jgi:hypothetical protein
LPSLSLNLDPFGSGISFPLTHLCHPAPVFLKISTNFQIPSK